MREFMNQTKGTIVSAAVVFAIIAGIVSVAGFPFGTIAVAIVGIFSIALSVLTVLHLNTETQDMAELQRLRQLQRDFDGQAGELRTAMADAARVTAEKQIADNANRREQELAATGSKRVVEVEAEMLTLRKTLKEVRDDRKRYKIALKKANIPVT